MMSHIHTACSGSSQKDIAYELECPPFLLYWDPHNPNFSIEVQCAPLICGLRLPLGADHSILPLLIYWSILPTRLCVMQDQE